MLTPIADGKLSTNWISIIFIKTSNISDQYRIWKMENGKWKMETKYQNSNLTVF
jgi:hypothetical protein